MKTCIHSSPDATSIESGAAIRTRNSRFLAYLSGKLRYIAKQNRRESIANSRKCADFLTKRCETSRVGEIELRILLMNSVTDPLIAPELSPVRIEFEKINITQIALAAQSHSPIFLNFTMQLQV
jgi:hypothetical protein